jgi:hypothetical protein
MRFLPMVALAGTVVGVPLVSGLAPASPAVQVTPGDLSNWVLFAGTRTSFLAVQEGTGTGVAPHFEIVQLGRLSGASVIICGSFAGPTLRDNGFVRSWEYVALRPSSGPCASGGTGDFVAVGRRGAVEVRTTGIP